MQLAIKKYCNWTNHIQSHHYNDRIGTSFTLCTTADHRGNRKMTWSTACTVWQKTKVLLIQI